MMDLYEAIETVNEYLEYCEKCAANFSPTEDELEAIRICLEAARDKAGI